MIKFFRNIRHILLTENKFSKYLLYALGEIILVVLGILIALQINSWNNNKKNQQKELIYITSIIEDIESDVTNSKIILNLLNTRIKGLDNLLTELSSERIYTNSNKAYGLWMDHIGFTEFISNDRTLQLLKHSSGFEFITRKEASDAILEYDQNVEGYYFQTELISDFLSNPQYFHRVFDVISLEKVAHDSIPIPLLVKDRNLLNQLYGNRKVWKIGLSGLIDDLEKVHESGKKTKNKLQEVYNLNAN